METVIGLVLIVTAVILAYFVVRGRANQLWSDVSHSGTSASAPVVGA